jgi:hypothetical protein
MTVAKRLLEELKDGTAERDWRAWSEEAAAFLVPHAAPVGKRERMEFYAEAMSDPKNHGALALELAYLRALSEGMHPQGCELGRGSVTECGSSPACGCPAALADLRSLAAAAEREGWSYVAVQAGELIALLRAAPADGALGAPAPDALAALRLVTDALRDALTGGKVKARDGR